MNEAENNNSFKMKFIDKLIVSMIGVANIIVIIITIVSVNHNYKRMHEQQLKRLNDIPYNETYKYLESDNTIAIYKDVNAITEYKCVGNCKITRFSSSQFIIDNDDLIPIEDNGKVNLFSVSKNKTTITLDDIPLTSINNKYGIIRINNKDGIISKHGKIVLDCIYSDIDINTSHIVTINSNTIYVFDNDAKLLASKPITTSGDISISEKNNNLYINIFDTKNTTLIFDIRANKFST